MPRGPSRRDVLRAGAAGGVLSFLSGLPAVSAEEAKLDPKVVRLDPEIEPLVRFLEDTPRDRLLEETAARVKKGLTYREVLAALLLAGVRNVEPRPQPGFKFHAVLVVNSAHLASLSSPDSDRWLPIFWALDFFKDSQAKNLKENKGWRMPPVDEAKVPAARAARKAFTDAMDNWDPEAADAAAAGLARTASADEIFDLYCRYGGRDFRSIGHKIIYVCNSRRTLACIGRQHAEPVLRSLAYALLSHEGDNPAKRDDPADLPGRRNAELAAQVKLDHPDAKPDAGAAAEVLSAIRSGTPEDTCKAVVEVLARGAAVSSVWDGLFAGGGELLMRQPGIVGLHTMTTTNAFRFAFDTAATDQTRRWLLLQNAAFLPMFREAMERRGQVNDRRIDKLEAAKPSAGGAAAIEEIFADIGKDKPAAAGKVLAYLKDGGDAKPLIDAARVLVFRKGNDAHDYKFSSAVLEDWHRLSSDWRDRYLASAAFQLRGSGAADNALVGRIRAALG